MSLLRTDRCSYRYGHGTAKALDSVTMEFEKGGFYGLLGPNGSGKSTLLRLLTGTFTPQEGTVYVKDKPLASMKRRDLARLIAFVPQDFQMDFPFTVYEMIMMGRFSYQGIMGKGSPRDDQVVAMAMELTRTAELSDRAVTHLSGGELQRVLLAQALAQESEILLLDEPTSHLDIRFQLEILELLKELKRSMGLTIISSLHDLNLASLYCHHLFFMKKGELVTHGPVEEVFTEEIITGVFDAPVKIVPQPEGGHPLMMLTPEKLHVPKPSLSEEKVGPGA
jgi:iron complex transport system ATP-binding protein